MNKKEYIGDAVYAAVDERGLVLTTEDGYQATNTIVLDPSVLVKLEGYIARRRLEVQTRKEKNDKAET